MKNMKKINGNEMEYIKNLRNNIDNERKNATIVSNKTWRTKK